MLVITLLLNTIWFAMAFNVFWLRRRVFAKVLVPREQRDTPVFETLTQSGKFLGGFNLAFSLLNLLLLLNFGEFNSERQWAILLLVNAIAHGSQFTGNLPIAIENLRGVGVWQVLKGTMLLIFVVDCALMLLNAYVATGYLFT